MSEKKPILIVEDDPDIREVLQQLLQMEGYSVITANNGQEALTLLKTTNNLALILLDLFMPVMNGLQFLDQYKTELPEKTHNTIPILILSAAPPQGEMVQSVVPKASGFIRKPIDLDHFLKVVNGFCYEQLTA